MDGKFTLQSNVCETPRVDGYTLSCPVAMLAVPCPILELSLLVVRLVVYRALG